jgi:hypothetical protein
MDLAGFSILLYFVVMKEFIEIPSEGELATFSHFKYVWFISKRGDI